MEATVTCPCGCGHTFVTEVKRHSDGAKYALEWDSLPEWHKKFLSWWLSNPLLANMALRKEDLKSGFKYVDMDAINARISELKALRLVLPDKERGRYTLNVQLAIKLANNGWLISAIREEIIKMRLPEAIQDIPLPDTRTYRDYAAPI